MFKSMFEKMKLIAGFCVVLCAMNGSVTYCMRRYLAAMSRNGIVKVIDMEDGFKQVKEHNILAHHGVSLKGEVYLSNWQTFFDGSGKHMFAIATLVDRKKEYDFVHILDVCGGFSVQKIITGLRHIDDEYNPKGLFADVSQDGRFLGLTYGRRVKLIDCKNNFSIAKGHLREFFEQIITNEVRIKFVGQKLNGPKFIAFYSDYQLCLLKPKISKNKLKFDLFQELRSELGDNARFDNLVCNSDASYMAVITLRSSDDGTLGVGIPRVAVYKRKEPTKFLSKCADALFPRQYKCVETFEKQNLWAICFGVLGRELLSVYPDKRNFYRKKIIFKHSFIDDKAKKNEDKVKVLHRHVIYNVGPDKELPYYEISKICDDGSYVVVGGGSNPVLIFQRYEEPKKDKTKYELKKRFDNIFVGETEQVVSLSISPVVGQNVDFHNKLTSTVNKRKYCDCVVKTIDE